eukprot:scaffold278631_cov48-Prasinocladus_malaysianus.AAC.1
MTQKTVSTLAESLDKELPKLLTLEEEARADEVAPEATTAAAKQGPEENAVQVCSASTQLRLALLASTRMAA